MKLRFILLILSLYFIDQSSGTKCYGCGYNNYDVCRDVGSKTPIIDYKNKFGCITVWRNATSSNGTITSDLRISGRDAISSEYLNSTFCAEEITNIGDEYYKCCSGDLCNSAEGVQAKMFIILITTTYFVYHLL